ncbi:MAG: agmatinase [Proteobacteria bacterium]|jgi:guanidinopropionase|nr:agmatinase [Gammaproteobacteria bacterium]MCP4830257.1 agmatinase [Pseudomonadota bacterium]MDP6949576.1 arginase family protein [Arenicellales bacterium]HJP06234.1 arginase family protein [Arenicellales bacterium]|tara:strand:- start:1169 stop:2131 length:963 start_codon:yes stop_codon:yes gene_type:complete
MPRNIYAPVDAAKVPRFSDIATFLRTKRAEISEDIDIGLCGVPFDIGLNYRTGPREGPGAVRHHSRIIRQVHQTTGVQPHELCNIADIGDAPINPLSKDESIANIEAYFADLKSKSIRPIAVGGDHTIPTPILRGIAADTPVGVLHVDAHADTLDEFCGDKVNHATFMRRASEEGLIDPKRVVQLGLRGSRFSPHDIQFGIDAGWTVITFDDYEEMGREAAIKQINETLGLGSIYVSIDIDGLDPTECPATPVPEIGGISARDMQVILRSLQGADIVGADISEIAPCFDNPTGITSIVAANLMFELVCIMAFAIDQKRLR